MKTVKTYWDEVKDQETFYYGGSNGWEIHLRKTTYVVEDKKSGKWINKEKLEFNFPFRAGDGVSKEEKAQTRKDVSRKRKLEKILASASVDRSEYLELCKRVSTKEEQIEIIEIFDKGLKGFNLRNYIATNYFTRDEAYSLFYRM